MPDSFPASPPIPQLVGERRPDFLRDELLSDFVAATAARCPNQPALRCHGHTLSYRDLVGRAAQLARHLRQSGVRPADRVVVWMQRGEEMYVVMLGILQAGATYVPVDPDCPTDRVAYVAQDCGAACLVVSGGASSGARTFVCRTLIFAELQAELAAQAPIAFSRTEQGVGPDDCAYIIYTSGSTGRPKGVMVSHRAICHFVRSEGAVLGLVEQDLVFQGSSLSFDMSLEEIWPAWAVGATLLVGTAEVLRAGIDLAAILAREGVTVWTCVPTLLAMQEHRIPTLRLLNLGGEACPPELVRAWARPGLRILNTYGPTEATVTATYTEVTPNQPITIGRPLPNYLACILPEEGGDFSSDGAGELCLGGPGLAHGYVGRPDLTRERFVAHLDPLLGVQSTWYRTGDRARINEAGEIEFLGRLDSQVKIRGFRVELSEIESVLSTVPGVKHTAVTLYRDAIGHEVLVAYVVTRGDAWDEQLARTVLQQRLPPYMIPAVFERLAALPTSASGKTDRKRLPAPTRVPEETRELVQPVTATERVIHAAFEAIFGLGVVSIDDDFFLGLGGHSLRAAALVSALRRQPELRHVSMVDVYKFPTVRALSVHLEGSRPKPVRSAAADAHATVPTRRYYTCAVAQAIGLIGIYGLFSLQWLIPYLSYAWLYDSEGFQRLPAIAISLSLFIVAIPIMLAIGVVAKWIVLGRLAPGDYPLWGLTYFRWWFTERLLDTVPTSYLGGSPLLGLYYRLLGARIGRGVMLRSDALDAPDCVSIGDDTSVAPGATLACCKVEGGWLKVRSVQVGSGCYIGASAVVGPGARMEDGGELDDLSMLPPGQTLPAGEKWSGSPARWVGPVESEGTMRTPRWKRGAYGAGFLGLLLVFPLFAILPIFPGMMLMIELDQNTDAYGFVALSPVLALCFVGSMCLQIAALKWLLLGRVKPARVPVFSLAYVRHWVVDQLMELSLDIASPLYATLYLNPWYRLLGVRLQARAEVSTASAISYDLLAVGEESFVADAVSLGAPRVHRGWFTLRETHIGRRTFVGNSAVVPAGTQLGDGVLVGVLSTPPRDPADALKKDSSWFGTPALFLPQRQVAAQFDEGSTFRPKRRLIAQRLAIEFFRVIIPLTVMIALTSLMMSFVVDLDDAEWSAWEVGLVFPLLYIAYALVVAALVVAIKWLVVGRYRPVEKPLWNPFVWRSELVTSTYENLAVPLFAEPLRGTPFLPMYLRLLGCKIGRRVYLDTTDITEHDMVRIGDEAALNRDSGPQTHLFEDRVMKISRVEIGARCVVGTGSIILYDARMENDSRLGDLSLLMKGETLPANTRWEGSPARPCA